jgi:hypothetical protein
MDFTVLAVPVVVTGFMFVVRFLAGLEMFANGASVKPFLRFALVLISLVGIANSSLLTGEPVNPDGVSSLTWIALETGVRAFGSHWLYIAVRGANRPLGNLLSALADHEMGIL